MCQENATTAIKKLNGDLSRNVSVFSVIRNVTRKCVKNFPLQNTQGIEVSDNQMSQNGYTRQDTGNHTQNVYHISRPVDTQDKEMPMVHTRLRNGENLKSGLKVGVLIAEKRKSLRKITSNLSRAVGQIISKISNHFAEVATAVSGRSFNIYENPELLQTLLTDEK